MHINESLEDTALKIATPVIESFEATAERIVKYQLGYTASLVGRNPERSLQPYKMKGDAKARMHNPFLLQTYIDSDGVLRVIDWFLAKCLQTSKNPITAWSRGGESGRWVITRGVDMDELEAGAVMSAEDEAVLQKALDRARRYLI